MTSSPDLFLAVLAMDSYNRGYGQGIDGLSSAAGTRIGEAAILQDANDIAGTAKAAGFYAVAYKWGDKTIIAYRGTDDGSPCPAPWQAARPPRQMMGHAP